METQNETRRVMGVQIGRFAPYHKGHQLITEKMVQEHGAENSLIMVGSSNVFNLRTPFTYEQRMEMIRRVVGDGVRIVPLPDVNPALLVHAESTIPLWLENIRTIESALGVKFHFYGGSDYDVRFFADDDREVLNREIFGGGVSGTEIRRHLTNEDYESLKGLVDDRIIDDVIRYFRQNLKELLINQ